MQYKQGGNYIIDTKKKVKLIADYAMDKKACDLVVYDLTGICAFTDYFLICSGSTHVQVKAIAGYIEEKLREKKVRPNHIEGYKEGKWIFMD